MTRKDRGSEKPAPLKPRRRGEPDTPATQPKSYTLPFSVVVEIRKAAAVYGSQGRALQVGSEILVRMTKPLPVPAADPDSLIRMTYKLAPRTIELIDEMAHSKYEGPGEVLAACIKALKVKNLRW